MISLTDSKRIITVMNDGAARVRMDGRWASSLIGAGVVLFAGSALLAQQTQFQGSVPTGVISPTPLSLTLRDAIDRGLKTNLGLLLSGQASETARGERLRSLSALLPQVTGEVSENVQQIDLPTHGIDFHLPGGFSTPAVVGPFHYTDARAYASFSVFDYSLRKSHRAAQEGERAAQLSFKDARDLVVQSVANAYLLVIAGSSRVQALRAQVETDEAVYDRTADQKRAGTAAAIDVLRAPQSKANRVRCRRSQTVDAPAGRSPGPKPACLWRPVMMPQFLQTVLGYTAENAGLVLSGGGLVVLLEMPIVGALAGRYPAKYIIASGWLALALGMYVSTLHLDTLISFQSASVLRVMQSVGLGLLFVPVTMAGYIGLPAEKANSVAGIINFMRNIGSSVGTSLVTTLLARRAQVHQVALSQHTTPFDPSLQNHVKALSLQLVHSGASVADAHKLAYGLLYRVVGGQAETLAYIDVFIVLTIAASIMFLLSFIVRKNDPKAGGGVAVG